MIRASHSQNIVCEQQAKFLQERIISTEKNFAELCTILGAYTRKAAGLRDKNDEFAKVLKTYADGENVNKSLKTSLSQFSAILAGVGDYRDVQVKRLEKKVVAELSQYESICKHARDEVKSTFSARDRELVRKRHLDRIRERSPANRQMITLAETELLKASAEVSRTVKGLEEQMDVFEKKKLQDIKSVLLDFVTVELSFQVKAIELFTQAYQELQTINVDDDLEEFRDALRVPDVIYRLETVKRTSFRASTPLGSLTNFFTTPPHLRRPSAEVTQSPTKDKDQRTLSVDSLKKSIGDSAESVVLENFIEDDSSYLTDEEEHRQPKSRLQ